MKIHTFKKYAAIAAAGLLTASAVALAAQCLSIYRAGEFTRAAVSQAFRPISWLIYLSLAATLASIVLSLVARAPEEKPKALRQTRLLLSKARAKADLAGCEAEVKAQILAQRKSQKRLTAIKYGVTALCGLVFLVYALNGSHFSNTDINGSMVRAMKVAIPCLAIALDAVLLADARLAASWEAEMALLKQAPKQKAGESSPAPKKNYGWLRYAALGAAIALLAFGYFTGGTVDVLTKAVNICTECVGLG